MRNLIALVLATLLALAVAPQTRAAVGFQHFYIPDPKGPPIEVAVWYPTGAPPKAQVIELSPQTVATDAPIKGDRLPLVVISHGHGGSFVGHLDTAIALAKAGFIAAALTHNGDSCHDSSHAVEIWERPRQLKVLTDYMLGAWRDRRHIDPDRIGAFGFSAGGFTVLAAAGAEPDLRTMKAHCQAHPSFEDCRIVAGHPLPADTGIVWTHDTRIKAVVSAAPALGFAFGREGLAAVQAPVQLWRAADDQVLPHPYYAEAVRLSLPTPPETHVVPHAGHYDFLAPCSARLAKEVPAICVSEPGFDRAKFHEQLDRDVVAFFTRTLK
jgi:predicted dienelactone hydrolase